MYIYKVEGTLATGENVLAIMRMGKVPFKLGAASLRSNGNQEFAVEPKSRLVIFGSPKKIDGDLEAVGQWVI